VELSLSSTLRFGGIVARTAGMARGKTEVILFSATSI